MLQPVNVDRHHFIGEQKGNDILDELGIDNVAQTDGDNGGSRIEDNDGIKIIEGGATDVTGTIPLGGSSDIGGTGNPAATADIGATTGAAGRASCDTDTTETTN